MSALRGHTVDRPWGRLRVWVGGDGPPLLALHGLGGSGRYWTGLTRALGERFTVIAPDLAGFGHSDAPAGAIDRQLLSEDLDAVVERFARARRVGVVGHSLGCTLGALWASGHADRVGAIALCAATYPAGNTFDPRWSRRPGPARRAMIEAVRAVWPILAVPVGVLRGFPAAVVVDFGRQSIRGRAWSLWSLWSDPSIEDELDAATPPTHAPALLLNAADDRRAREADLERWAARMPRAERRIVRTGGHQFLLRGGFTPLADWLLGLPDWPEPVPGR